MKCLLLLLGLLAGWVAGPVSAQAVRPPGRRPYPHYRPPERRHLKHYQPKTWRERVPVATPHLGPAGTRRQTRPAGHGAGPGKSQVGLR